MIEASRLGWMAGVFDLRGKVLVKANQQRATRQIVLMVETKQLYIVRELSLLTGTNPECIAEHAMPDWSRRSCTEHCPDAHVHVEKKQMPGVTRWTITGSGVATVLYNTLPYMVSDHPWTALMFETIGATPLFGRGSGTAVATIRRLEKLGWELPPQFEAVSIKNSSPGGSGSEGLDANEIENFIAKPSSLPIIEAK